MRFIENILISFLEAIVGTGCLVGLLIGCLFLVGTLAVCLHLLFNRFLF
jgi:hypothetical protein